MEVKLKDYNRYNSEEPIALWNADASSMDIEFEFDDVNRVMQLSDLHFEMEADRENSMALVSRSVEGQVIRWEHELNGNELSSTLSFEGFGTQLGESFTLDWNAAGIPNEKGIDWERQHSSIYFKEVGLGRDYLTDGRSDEV